MNENPFNFSKPVKGEYFYNRTKEIENAVGFTKNLQSFSVVGERRIGKTSLLEHILSEEILKDHGIDPEKYIIVHFNMGELYGITKDMLIETIVEKIRAQERIEVNSGNTFEELSAYVAELGSNGKNLIIALDEFEVIAPILNGDFSYWLRSIFEKPHAMAITASRITVGEIGSGGTASPLFNIFGNLFLKLFSQKETEKMISEMFLRGGVKLDSKEISFLAKLSGGNPYLIQFIGYHYYEEKKGNRRVGERKFENEMLDHLRNQFKSYWKYLSQREREFLLGIESAVDNQIGHVLERKGFIVSKKGKWRFFSPLFERFISIKEEEFKDNEKERNRDLYSWIFGVMGLAALAIGMRFIMTGIDKLQKLYMGSIAKFVHDPNFVVGLCSLIFSILSFVISLTSRRRSKQEIHQE